MEAAWIAVISILGLRINYNDAQRNFKLKRQDDEFQVYPKDILLF